MNEYPMNRILEVLERVLCIKPNTIKTTDELTKDLGANSIDMMEIVIGLEDEFGVEIFCSDVENENTVIGLSEMIKGKLQNV